MRRIFQVLVCWAGLLLAMAPGVQAGPLLLAGTIGAQNFCASDNNLGCTWGATLLDIDPLLGSLALAPATLGGINVQGSLHTETIGTHNVLNSSSLQITNNTLATVNGTVAVGSINFLGPIVEASLSGSGTWQDAQGSTIALRWHNDPANQQGAQTPTDTPGIQLSTFSDTAGPETDSFAHTLNNIAVIDPALFGMTLSFDLSLVAGGQLTSRGQTITKDQVEAPIPEPGSMILLGTGLFALAAKFRRRFPSVM